MAGDLEDPGQLAALAAARAHNREIIVIASNQAGARLAMNLILSLQAQGIANYIWLTDDPTYCKALFHSPLRVACGWSSYLSVRRRPACVSLSGAHLLSAWTNAGASVVVQVARELVRQGQLALPRRSQPVARPRALPQQARGSGLQPAVPGHGLHGAGAQTPHRAQIGPHRRRPPSQPLRPRRSTPPPHPSNHPPLTLAQENFYRHLKTGVAARHNLFFQREGEGISSLNIGFIYCQNCSHSGRGQWVLDETLRRIEGLLGLPQPESFFQPFVNAGLMDKARGGEAGAVAASRLVHSASHQLPVCTQSLRLAVRTLRGGVRAAAANA